VMGGGLAGCFAAIKAREYKLDVFMIYKAYAGKSGASVAAGVAYMVFNPEWGHNLDVCMDQISKKGEYLNNREWSEIVLKESYARYQDLVGWGVKFPIEDGKHAKDYYSQPFGKIPIRRRGLTPVLRKQAEKSGVKIMDRIMVTDLLKQDGRIVGAIGFPIESYHLYIFKAKATVICMGSNSFKPTGYPVHSLTGDGDAMAYRAGNEITGKEFPDTHFTMADYPGWRFHGGSMAGYRRFIDALWNLWSMLARHRYFGILTPLLLKI
ncbi:MAG: FAD-binding protein, partial [Deltaproteobacteria bacterium]|nr:FAD-binding protein [Deltaproteobacteria bacterium]